MPGFLLHAGAKVMCMHAGQAQPTAPNLRVTVGGKPVMTQPSPYTVAACPFVTGGSPSPCVTAQWITAATRVLAGGAPVLLQDSAAICAPNGTGLKIVVTELRAKGV